MPGLWTIILNFSKIVKTILTSEVSEDFRRSAKNSVLSFKTFQLLSETFQLLSETFQLLSETFRTVSVQTFCSVISKKLELFVVFVAFVSVASIVCLRRLSDLLSCSEMFTLDTLTKRGRKRKDIDSHWGPK